MSDDTEAQQHLVLVVDDDPVMRRMARYALEKDDLQVIEAADGAQGLEMFKQRAPNFVIFDGMMPVLDGFNACAELRRLPGGAFTPVLMVTALDDEESVDRAFAAGATDYVTKPVRWTVLRRRVIHLLEASMVETVQARTEAVVRHATDAIITCNGQCVIESANPSAERIFLCPAREMIGQDLYTFLVGQEGHAHRLPGASGEVSGRRKDGSLVPLEYSMNEFTAHGQHVQVLILHDISERKQAEAALRNSEERYRSIITSMAEGVFIIDEDGIVTSCNASAERIFGLAAESLRGRPIADLAEHAIHEDGTPYPLQECPSSITLRTGKPQDQVVIGIHRPNGSLLWLVVSTQPLYQSRTDGRFGVVLSCLDITERQELMQRQRYSSTHDILTGLYNRAYFEEEMSRLEDSRQLPVSIVMADIDDMKRANDVHGHSAGDQLLQCAASIMRDAFRTEDIVARVGGDEFAVILPAADETVAARALQRVERLNCEWNATHIAQPLRMSVGAATAHSGQILVDTWKQADAHMYRVKLQHKSQ